MCCDILQLILDSESLEDIPAEPIQVDPPRFTPCRSIRVEPFEERPRVEIFVYSTPLGGPVCCGDGKVFLEKSSQVLGQLSLTRLKGRIANGKVKKGRPDAVGEVKQ